MLWGIISGVLWLNLYSGQIQENPWLYSTPEEQGIDSAILDEILQNIKQQHHAIDSLVIVRHGYLVLEEYLNLEEYLSYTQSNQDSMHSLYSTTKSFTSALIGIAIDKGYIDNVSLKVVDFFPEYEIKNLDARKKNMTLHHLLTMTSGFEFSGDNAYEMLGSGNSVKYMLDLPMKYNPGSKLDYITGVTHLLSAIIQKTTGTTTLEFAREYLFNPLGINTVQWTYDRQNINHGDHGLSLTSRDMAKFGILYLNNGTWNGKQIISTDWVIKSTHTYNLFEEYSGYGYQWYTDISGYGYQWWTFPEISVYYTKGYHGQNIFVAPEKDLVVVFTANLSNDLITDEYFLSIYSAVN